MVMMAVACRLKSKPKNQPVKFEVKSLVKKGRTSMTKQVVPTFSSESLDFVKGVSLVCYKRVLLY